LAVRQTVHVVDDDASFRRAVSRLLRAAGYDVCVHASARDYLLSRRTGGLTCVLADLNMPGTTGIELQESLRTTECPVPVVFLTGHGDIATTVRAMRNGAVDFLIKPVDRDRLFDAIQRAFARASTARQQREQNRESRSRYESLTPREHEVMTHVIAGKLNKQIAFELGTGERNIKAHRANMMRKLGIRSVAELTRLALCLGVRPA
jgi:FixJ family two-component response regulator